jgi:hypothetical protein
MLERFMLFHKKNGTKRQIHNIEKYMPFPHTCITRILRPVSCASCSRMCLVGFGVALNAAFRVSNCFALIVVLGNNLTNNNLDDTSIMNSPQSSPEPIKEDETSLLKISSDSNHSTQSCDTNGNSIHNLFVVLKHCLNRRRLLYLTNL